MTSIYFNELVLLFFIFHHSFCNNWQELIWSDFRFTNQRTTVYFPLIISYHLPFICNCIGHTLFLRHPKNDEGWFRLSFQTSKAWYISIYVHLQHLLISIPISPSLSWALDLHHHPIPHAGCIRFKGIVFHLRQMGLQVLMSHRLN